MFGYKFKCTNLSELRDETIYDKLKKDTQREYLLLMFLFNLVRVYFSYCYCKTKILDQLAIYSVLDKELREFYPYFIINNKNIIFKSGYIDKLTKSYLVQTEFYNIFELYDDNFNSKIILENLCEIKLSQEQFYSILLYFFNKHDYLLQTLDPYNNSRSIIIGNYDDIQITIPHSSNYKLRDSLGNIYSVKYHPNDLTFSLIFTEQFKKDVINQNWSDGYDFYWKNLEKDTQKDKKNISNCIKYLVEILTPDDVQIMTMTITRTPTIVDKQIHYYIKRCLTTEIKSIIDKTYQHKNVSILLHSFACWLFDAKIVYSFLMDSMLNIFKKNGIEILIIDRKDDDDMEINKLGGFCIREIFHKIKIDDAFKNKWIGENKINILSEGHVKIYQLEQLTTSPITVFDGHNSTYLSNGGILNDQYYNKYLKYKLKYFNLKKQIK
jgi:hypothetical protein